MLNQVRDGQPHGSGSYAYHDPLGDSDHSDVDPKIAEEQPEVGWQVWRFLR